VESRYDCWFPETISWRMWFNGIWILYCFVPFSLCPMLHSTCFVIRDVSCLRHIIYLALLSWTFHAHVQHLCSNSSMSIWERNVKAKPRICLCHPHRDSQRGPFDLSMSTLLSSVNQRDPWDYCSTSETLRHRCAY
jgi:hypothetical protein